MKKLITLILAATFALGGFAACSDPCTKLADKAIECAANDQAAEALKKNKDKSIQACKKSDELQKLAKKCAGIKDCKKLADSATLRAAVAVRETCRHFVRSMMPPEYNERHAAEGNVALFLSAMHAEAAREALGESDGTERIVIDQFTFPERLRAALEKEGLHLDTEIRHRAEDNPAVAAASVLARAEFLRPRIVGG